MRKPAARTRRAVSSSRAVPEAPAHSGSDGTELRAEVAQTGRGEQGVAERVRGDVAVRVALEPLGLVGPGEPGQVQGHAVGEPVHVDSRGPTRGRCSLPGSLTRRIMPRPHAGA